MSQRVKGVRLSSFKVKITTLARIRLPYLILNVDFGLTVVSDRTVETENLLQI